MTLATDQFVDAAYDRAAPGDPLPLGVHHALRARVVDRPCGHTYARPTSCPGCRDEIGARFDPHPGYACPIPSTHPASLVR
jgi:hypothetical protein